MGRRGPLPFPTKVKADRGTLRADRTNPAEPVTLPAKAPRPPAWLDAEGVKAWRRLVRVLTATRVLGAQDVALLAVLADQLSVYERCARFLQAKGGESFVVTDGDGTPTGVHAWPEVRIKAAAATEIRRLCEHFGLSPASRARVNAAAPAGPVDDLAAFLNEGVS